MRFVRMEKRLEEKEFCCCATLLNHSFSIRKTFSVSSRLHFFSPSLLFFSRMPSGKYIHWKNSLGSYFIYFFFSSHTQTLALNAKQTVCGGDGIKLKLFFSFRYSIHEWIKLKAFPVGMAVVIMWEKAHLTIANSDNSQAKMLPIKLIFIVFRFCFLPLPFFFLCGTIKVYSLWESNVFYVKSKVFFTSPPLTKDNEAFRMKEQQQTITFQTSWERKIFRWKSLLSKAKGWRDEFIFHHNAREK